MEAQALSVAHQVGVQREKSEQNRKRRFDDTQRPKREHNQNRRVEREKKAKPIPEIVTPKNCRDVLSRMAEPLHDLDYEAQLELKRLKCRDAVAAIQTAIGQESDVDVAETIASPLTAGYRSCDTFRAGPSVFGSEVTAVGYFVRSGESGAVCIPPYKLISLRSEHKVVCDAYDAVVRRSQLPECVGAGRQEPGHWRDITVKSNDSGEILAVIHFHPQEMGLVELTGVKDLIVETFRSHCPAVRSLFFRPSAARHASPSEAPAELIYGKEFLEERIGDTSFKMRLGAETMNPPNPSIAAKFIEVVRRELKLKGDGVLFHVSCKNGGLLSIASANEVSKCFVFGEESELSEAICNADGNGVYNCVFKPMDNNGPLLSSTLRETAAEGRRISVLLTAGKSGLDFSFIRALRTNGKVRRIVYVLSKTESRQVMANFAALSAFKPGAGKPFKLTSAIPIDSLPNTHHCEYVLTWTR